MEEQLSVLFVLVEVGGVLAPIAFILFHTLRQFLFIPPMLVCIAGGILFGATFGIVYSIIGLTINCIFFYLVIHRFPKTYQKLRLLKIRWFGEYRNLTISQITVLRLIPIFHYHLLNFCLLEKRKSFLGFAKGAFFSNIPIAIFYTIFGQFISQFSITMIVIIMLALGALAYILREKITIIKWRHFFNGSRGQET